MRAAIIAAVIAFTPTVASADTGLSGDIWLNIYGRSYHTDRDPLLNERNGGLGAYVDRGSYFLETGIFKDSYSKLSPYAGVGKYIQVAGPLYVGAGAFVMARDNYRDYSPFLGVLPLLSVRGDWASLNISYVPRYEAWKLHETVFFYSSIRFGGM